MSDGMMSLPTATEQEADVLGTCMAEGLSWWRRVELLGGGDDSLDLFWDDNHKLVAAALLEVSKSNGAVTLASLSDRLLSRAGSDRLVPNVSTYLTQLQARASIKTQSDLTATVMTLKEQRQLRRQIARLDEVRAAALSGEVHPNEVSAALREASSEGITGTELKSFGQQIQEMEDEDSLGVPWRLSTGIEALDAVIRGGYEPGRLYVFGARPKVGKTTVIQNSVLEALAAGAVVLFASLEINRVELWSKLLSAQAWVPQRTIQDILDGKKDRSELTSDEQQDLRTAERALKGCKLYTLFSPDITQGVDTVINATMSLRNKYGMDVPMIVFIDYIQLAVSGESFNKSAEIGVASRKLKLSAQDLQVSMVTPSQINRAGAEDGMPHPHQLRESGNLEQDADVVVMLNRPALQDDTEPEHIMDMWVALNRIGPSANIKAGYYPEYQTVRDLMDEGAIHDTWGAADDIAEELRDVHSVDDLPTQPVAGRKRESVRVSGSSKRSSADREEF